MKRIEERKKKLTPKHVIFLILEAIVILLLLTAYIFPMFYMISTSLKTMREVNVSPPTLWPEILQWQNYAEAWQKMNFFHYFKNSVFISVMTIVGQLLVCVPCAYALAKKQFVGRKFFHTLVLFDLIVPSQIIFLSIYLIESKINWINTYQGLIVPFIYSAFSIFFLIQTFKTLPDDVLDAAKLDKCSEIQIIGSIILPMAKPTIITTVMFTFVYKWNDYFWTSILTTDDAVRTLPLAIQNLMPVGNAANEWHTIMAGNLMLFAPMFLLYLLANKSIKQMFVYGGIK
ncbi:MAG TPA: carbohydrate ABC transporter permease [Oscillospiraceae bacterium]|jgi:sn-glycerol 3-phosphate transport system permease protein|nr:carbohydrate ABC transporter permease [Oscillospiraceae bacterium]HRW56583.1 carbohydrate ABC transporter permease [Oscillospiraceae bacterium]